MIEPGPPSPKAVKLLAPRGWRGEAITGYQRFEFEKLPWLELEREGEKSGAAELVKASRSRKVFRLERCGPEGAPEVLFAKRYLLNSLRRHVSARLAGVKARREFELGRQARALGVPTPEPLAYGFHFSSAAGGPGGGRLPPASYLLTREWPNAGSLADWTRKDPSAAAGMWADLAVFLAEIHAAGFYHDDLAADHILVGDGKEGPACGAFGLIDLDNGRIYPGGVPPSQCQVNIFQILRSVTFGSFPRSARRQFLEAYLAASTPRVDMDLKGLREAIGIIARRKIGKPVL